MSPERSSSLKDLVFLICLCLGSIFAVFKFHRLQDVASSAAWVLLYCSVGILPYLKAREKVQLDPREPPLITASIPYFGHLVGILLYGSQYFKSLGHRQRSPIFTLPVPGSRLYVVTEPSLAASVQRASKTLSFSPLVPPIIQRVAGFDNVTISLMKSDMEHGYIQQVQDAVQSRLAQGQYLDEVTLKACNEFLDRINSLKADLGEGMKTLDLLGTLKHLVTVATATFFYGPNNPVQRDPSLIDRFWDFDEGIPGLLLGVVPSVTARKAYRGREAVVRALSSYLESPQYAEAAEITRKRSEIGQSFGVSTRNIARSDLTFFFAGIVNTSLTSFWMILNIFARPQLLHEVRMELDRIIKPGSRTSQSAGLSIKDVVKNCRLLYAIFKEVLRMYSDNFATRVVLSDTLLADRYWLREGSIVQVSGGIIHADGRIWGVDVDTFRPERHLDSQAKGAPNGSAATEQPKQVHAAAFRAFGGGATLCPGRHFAVNEILALVAMAVLQLDISSPDGAEIHVPPKKDNVLPIHVLEPTKAVHVNIKARGGRAGDALVLSP